MRDSSQSVDCDEMETGGENEVVGGEDLEIGGVMVQYFLSAKVATHI